MTILFAGGEDISFTFLGTTDFVGFGGGGTAGRSTFARGGVRINSSAGDPPANRAQTPTFTPVSLLWVHGQASFGNSASSTANVQSLIVRSPDGVSRIVVRQTATAGLLKVSQRNAAGTITDLATASSSVTTGTNHSFDLKIDYSASGSILLYLDGALVINFSGDPRTDAATQLNQVELGSPCPEFTVSGGWSEVIIADEDTRGMALWTLAPQAAGTTQSWTPNTVGNINEVTLNDTTFVSTTANNALSEWTTPTSAPTGTSWAVKAIVQEARVRAAVTGPQHFDWIVRTGGADFLAGVSNAPTTSFGNFRNRIWANNPNTSAPWVIGDIATGFNLGIESLA
jgi:hypothetical protein